jgi:hypothetical protein
MPMPTQRRYRAISARAYFPIFPFVLDKGCDLKNSSQEEIIKFI